MRADTVTLDPPPSCPGCEPTVVWLAFGEWLVVHDERCPAEEMERG